MTLDSRHTTRLTRFVFVWIYIDCWLKGRIKFKVLINNFSWIISCHGRMSIFLMDVYFSCAGPIVVPLVPRYDSILSMLHVARRTGGWLWNLQVSFHPNLWDCSDIFVFWCILLTCMLEDCCCCFFTLFSFLSSIRFERRPSQDCVAYQSPGVAGIFGDPHIVTFDDLQYTFNGKGNQILSF